MKVGILQPGYLPWLGFFEQMSRVDIFILLDDVQYDKKSWRNRNRIRTIDGWTWLTVPVLTKGRFDQLISNVEINNTVDWGRKHLRALEVNYAAAPYIDDYLPFFKELYGRRWNYLNELNEEIIRFLAKELGLKTKIVRSSSLGASGKKTEKIISICEKAGADYLYDGASAINFIDEEMLNKAGILLEYQNYKHPVYRQCFPNFVYHLSVIDLMFNHGRDSLRVIKGESGDVAE